MRPLASLVAVTLTLLLASSSGAEEVAGLPLHVKRLGPGTVRVWLGDFVSSTAQVAFATSEGIVVVDTVGYPRVDAELRKVIARELGRNDFKVLINTHEHGDHTGGNAVYADCLIVGHEAIAAALSAPPADNAQFREWVVQRVATGEKELAALPPGSEQARKLAEELTIHRLGIENARSRPERVPPAKTFPDHLTLRMGDTTFEMTWIGGLHSGSDTAVFVPEQGLLLTGDVMADVWLTDTPGCLASFMARPGVPHDFPRMLANWDRILARKDAIKLLLPAHWNGELSLAGVQARVDYVRTLWDAVQAAVKAGTGLAELQTEHRLGKRFPALVNSPGFDERFNGTTIAEMWKAAANQTSAAEKLYELIDAGAPEASIREVLAERDKKVGTYYFLESEINSQGYRLLQAGKVAQAIAMFRLNVELFPSAWNVYDSLGEALLKSGDVVGATAMYEKSVQLNPESVSGREALAKLRAPAEPK